MTTDDLRAAFEALAVRLDEKAATALRVADRARRSGERQTMTGNSAQYAAYGLAAAEIRKVLNG